MKRSDRQLKVLVECDKAITETLLSDAQKLLRRATSANVRQTAATYDLMVALNSFLQAYGLSADSTPR